LKVQLKILDANVCSEAYEDHEYFTFTNNQLCAGNLDGGYDTCQGGKSSDAVTKHFTNSFSYQSDSGGPLQIVLPDNKCVYSIVGITSFGTGCGLKGAPSIYTRVSSYLDWIEEKVWN
jgi:secreted trypsin-like serine protease